MAVGVVGRYVGNYTAGLRAVRWDAAGNAVELGNLGIDSFGYTNTYANALNNLGDAAGYAQKIVNDQALGDRAVRWDAQSNAAIELETLGQTTSGVNFSSAYAINDSGYVAGTAAVVSNGVMDGERRAVRWNPSGTATALQNLYAGSNNVAYALAQTNWAAGRSVMSSVSAGQFVLRERAMRWDAAGNATELGNLGASFAGRVSSRALAINDSGTAVGSSEEYDENGVLVGRRAVRWNANSAAVSELGNLGDGTNATFNISQATTINQSGAAAGISWKYEAGQFRGERAVRWNADSAGAIELAHLEAPPAATLKTQAFGINDAGFVVGSSDYFGGNGYSLGQHAALWNPDGSVIDLNTLLPTNSGWFELYQALSITNDGWISGVGLYDPDGLNGTPGQERYFLIQVPEPTALAISGSTLLISRRRRLDR